VLVHSALKDLSSDPHFAIGSFPLEKISIPHTKKTPHLKKFQQKLWPTWQPRRRQPIHLASMPMSTPIALTMFPRLVHVLLRVGLGVRVKKSAKQTTWRNG
jgi:hypothetical protein